MKSSGVLYLLKDAIEITNKFGQTKVEDIAAGEGVFRHDVHRLLGYLLAVELVIRHETSMESLQNPGISENEVDEEKLGEKEGVRDRVTRKVERRLKFWSRKPDQIHAKILSCFLNILHLEGVSPVPVDVLKQRYVAERCTWDNVDPDEAEGEFQTYFTVMTTLSAKSECKVFDLANGAVSVWPNASTAVEAFRRQRRIAY